VTRPTRWQHTTLEHLLHKVMLADRALNRASIRGLGWAATITGRLSAMIIRRLERLEDRDGR
jgi:hypothetical protein